jgi:hypothetical protein
MSGTRRRPRASSVAVAPAPAPAAPIAPAPVAALPPAPSLRAVDVSEVSVDPFTNTPVVVLTCARSRASLPLFIGLAEASAITTELEKIALERPVTHDLLRDVLRCSGVVVDHVAVDDVRDGTVYATIHLVRSGEQGVERFTLDARPSDAIAIALRTGARIFVDEKVFGKLGVSATTAALGSGGRLPVTSTATPTTPPPAACGLPRQVTGIDEAQLRALLESLDDHEFGKWKQ